jgi:peptide/nickel transport system ATP-binding protein
VTPAAARRRADHRTRPRPGGAHRRRTAATRRQGRGGEPGPADDHPRPDRGRTLDGEPVRHWRHRAPRAQRTAFGVVFQQARLSADPRLPLADLIAEPLRATGRREGLAGRVAELAATVGLTTDLLNRRPHEVSDGQLQRACLARALVLRPRRLVCDEMTAMLDASTTAALVAVVEEDRAATGAGLLAVGHARTLLDRWCDRTVHWSALGPAPLDM